MSMTNTIDIVSLDSGLSLKGIVNMGNALDAYLNFYKLPSLDKLSYKN
jgi:hypothetical protein